MWVCVCLCMTTDFHLIKCRCVLNSLENVAFLKRLCNPALHQISSFHWSCRHATFLANRGHCCKQSQLPGKASLHCVTLTHILNFCPIFHLQEQNVGRTTLAANPPAAGLLGKRSWCLCKTVLCVLLCGVHKLQRMRNAFYCLRWFFIGPASSPVGAPSKLPCYTGGDTGYRRSMNIHMLSIVLIPWSSN